MASFGAVLSATLRCSWELPLAPAKTLTRFAEAAGSVVIGLMVITVLAIATTLIDPKSIGANYSDTAPQLDYSLGNLIGAFSINAAVSFAGLGFAAVLIYLINGAITANRFVYSRLPIEGFGTIWLGFCTIIENIFGLGDNTFYIFIFVLIFLVVVPYFLSLSYRIGGGLATDKAILATVIEFLSYFAVIGFFATRGGAL